MLGENFNDSNELNDMSLVQSARIAGSSQAQKTIFKSGLFATEMRVRKSSPGCLNVEVARKMISRLLVEKNILLESLAEALEITVKDLKNIFSHRVSLKLMQKINLPLIKIYCETNFG